MSKTQLQTNNTKYSQLIELLRGKAVGGGNVEFSYFTVNEYPDYEFPFMVGQTWGEWVVTSLNIIFYDSVAGYQKMFAESGKIKAMLTAGIGNMSSANTSESEVSLTDLIQPETTYYMYVNTSFPSFPG